MKKILIALGALLGLLFLAGIAVVSLVDVNVHKPRIEAVVSDVLGMEFRIVGKARLRLLPSAAISLSDIRLRNLGTDLIAAETLRVGVKLLPLLRRQVEVTGLVLENPVIRIEKGTDGKFNFEIPPHPSKATREGGEASPSLAVASATIRNGTLFFVDRKKGSRTEATGIDLSLKDLTIAAASEAPLSQGIYFAGKLRVSEVKENNLHISDVNATVAAARGVYDIRPFTMKLFGGKGDGEIRVDLSKEKPDIRLKCTLVNFRAEESLAAISRKKFLSGPMTFVSDLSFHGNGAEEMERTLRGSVSVRGEELTLHGMVIDEVLTKVKEAESLNLVDVGAFILAGPLGSMALKGYRFGGVVVSSSHEGETRLTRLVSDWTVHDGVAETKDVAFATRQNRIALKGKLDIVRERYVDFIVAALDDKGCVTVQQKITGPFRDPQLDKVSTLESAVIGQILGLFERTKQLLGRRECKPFYTGSVAHPR